jgi:predicted  nucleic acid-binding Zn-ribbon protein
MTPWDRLLDVQEVDSRLVKLDHRSAQLPERARLRDVEERLAGVRSRVEVAEAEKHELVKQQRRIEDEIASIQERIATEEQKLYSGGSSDAGLLQDLQDEIDGLKRRISGLEDDELELMEAVEPIDARLGLLADEQAGLDAEAIALTAALAEAESTIDAERGVALQDRTTATEGIDPDAIRRYEQVRDRLGGVAVARLESGTCGACHLKLSAVEHDRILHLPPEEEVECEECGRFLVRHVPAADG